MTIQVQLIVARGILERTRVHSKGFLRTMNLVLRLKSLWVTESLMDLVIAKVRLMSLGSYQMVIMLRT